MSQLHLNFYELSEATKIELKKHIRDQYETSLRNQDKAGKIDDETFNEEVKELFERNNAGIDIDIPQYMLDL